MENQPAPQTPFTGCLLVANPFSEDPFFSKSVVLILTHDNEGSLGVVLNQKTPFEISIVDQDDSPTLPVYLGGPVNTDDSGFLFLHKLAKLPEAAHVCLDWYYGGDSESIMEELPTGKINRWNTRIFNGYSGWNPKQLQEEINNGHWIVVKPQDKYFLPHVEDIWEEITESLTGNYQIIAKAAKDIQLN